MNCAVEFSPTNLINNENLLWVIKSGENPADVCFKCMWETCLNQFNEINQLTEHLNEHLINYINNFNNLNTNLICKVRGCNILVNSADELSRHLKMHIFHAQKMLNGLPIIRLNFPDLKSCNFPSSLCLVYQGDALICEWENCLQSFVDINLYVNHLTEHINLAKPKRINDCKQFYCVWGNECQMTFNDKSSLRNHIQHHSGDKMCACPFCGIFFSNNTKLMDHVLRRQEGNPNFFCFFCKKIFKTKRLLKNHCQRHLRNYKCTFCSIAVDSLFDLQRHIASVHAKIRNHFCEVCQRGFFQKSDLTKHMTTHNENLIFECKLCDKKYRWEKQLKQHNRTHEKNYIETPYLCHICEARYRRGSALSEHFTKKHQIQVPDGFSRFQFKKFSDGLFRLQTKRWLNKKLILEQNNCGDCVEEVKMA